MKRLMDKLIMYHEIHQLYREGNRPSQIARYLVLDTRTVKKIIATLFIAFNDKWLYDLWSYEGSITSRIRKGFFGK